MGSVIQRDLQVHPSVIMFENQGQQEMVRYTTIGLHAGSNIRTRLTHYRDDHDLGSMHEAVELLLEESGY